MKKKLYIRIISFLLCLISLAQCTADYEKKATETVPDEKKVQPENDTARQIAEYIDYFNYEISKYALSKEKDSCNNIFDASTKEKQNYVSIMNGLARIRPLLKSQNQSKNELLAIKIDSLKKDTNVKINNPILAGYITDSIFKDSIKYKEVFNFNKSRIIKPENLRDTGKVNEWRNDSAEYAAWKKNLQDTIKDKIINFKPNDPHDPPSKDYTPYAFVIAIILIGGFFLYSRIKLKKNENPDAKKHTQQQIANTAAAEPNADKNNEIIALKNNIKDLHDSIAQKDAIIKRLENEIVVSKNIKVPAEVKSGGNNMMYFPAPNNSSFPIAANSNTKRSFDAYHLEINGSTALFNLLCDDNEVVKRALDSPDIYIVQVCEIESSSANFGKATTIKLLEKGQLQKEGDQWILKKKSLIKLV
jgi:hypothetical protein